MIKHAIFLLLISCNVSAEFQTGVINGYIPYSSEGQEKFIIQLKNNVSGGGNTTSRFAIAESAANYDKIAAALMAAFHSKTPVTVSYQKTCNAWGNSYDFDFVCVGSIPC